ncbi:GmrSD restriction endonuclease domain-containing protein [Halocola ammonii]
MSVEARDRKIENWYHKIRHGELKLPRFQRHESWDRNRISSLLATIINDLPLGITLVLNVDKEQFISRYLVTAEFTEPPFPKVHEQLLDGQQRLTAIWRALHNNYEWEKYFLYLKEYDTYWEENGPLEDVDEEKAATAIVQNRWIQKKTDKMMPLWADEPTESLKRGCIPLELLRPEDISSEIEDWIVAALTPFKPQSEDSEFAEKYEVYAAKKQRLSTVINSYRETVKHYNLPFLALPSSTSKETALSVFINMNTNSKPLTQYDIIVAEIEGLQDTSLHELQEKLNTEHPSISRYFDLSFLILYTSALMQNKAPNKRGIWDMDKNEVVRKWDSMVQGLASMATFMEQNRIFDEDRLPTNAVLSVIAALYTQFDKHGDKGGQLHILLKKYLWSSFFTDRYENSAASRAFADYMNMVGFLSNGIKPENGQQYTLKDIPVLNRDLFPVATADELLHITWPKRVSIRGRGILAVANYFGAYDFADGSQITSDNVRKREYHHIFPDALVKEANDYFEEEINSTIALNCALITGKTNRVIGRKEPLTYLKERYDWASETIIKQRLQSHLIPVDELKAGDYEGLTIGEKAEKIKTDFNNFVQKRAQLISKAVYKLVEGEEVDSTELGEY